MLFHFMFRNAKSASSASLRKLIFARRFVYRKAEGSCPMVPPDCLAMGRCYTTSWVVPLLASTPLWLIFPLQRYLIIFFMVEKHENVNSSVSFRSGTMHLWIKYVSWAVECQPVTVRLSTPPKWKRAPPAPYGASVP